MADEETERVAEQWWPPDFETVFEFPENITALWTVGERVFARLANGKTVDCTSVVNGTKQ